MDDSLSEDRHRTGEATRQELAMEQLVTRVLFISIGGFSRASSRLRVHSWVPRLEQAGIQCRVVEYFGEAGSRRFGMFPAAAAAALRRWDSWTTVLRAIDRHSRWADTVVIQEALLPPRVLRPLRRRVKRFIFDFSDPIHLATSPADRFYRSVANSWFQFPRFHETLRLADAATVENDILLEVAGRYGATTHLVRGPVDTQLYAPGNRTEQHRDRDSLVIGWTGSRTTYPYLLPLLPIVERLAREYPQVELSLVGAPARPDVRGLRVHSSSWSMEDEPTQLRQFDIGVSYQPETPWTRVRGGSKLITYMAAGLPIVSSHFAIGDQVIKNGENGFLARTEEDWYTSLRTLVENPDLRRQMGATSRDIAVRSYSYEAYLPLMLSLLQAEENVVARSTS